VWCPEGGLVVRPGGECHYFQVWQGQMQWASAGRYSWERGVVEDVAGAIDEGIVELLEAELERWARSEEGRGWLRSHGVWGVPQAPPSRRAE